jgi:DNA mismatch repair ATPase MutS
MLVLGIKHHAFFWYMLSILLTAAFLYLVSLHNRHKIRRDLFQEMRSLNETEINCLDFQYEDLPDGADRVDRSHAWSYDLDIFGRGSMFQYLNRTSTLRGAQLLAGLLTSEPDGVEQIKLRQGIVKDLNARIDFRQRFTSRGRLVREQPDDLEDLSRWLSDEAYIQKQPWLFVLALVMSAASLVVAALVIAGTLTFWALILIAVVNLTILSPFLYRTNQYQGTVSKKHLLLEGYAELLKIIAGETFDHPELTEKGEAAKGGMQEVARLSRLLNLFDQRLNMLLGAILNSLFLFDFIMLRLLERWKKKNREQILVWIELIGWTDSFVSLGGYAFNHPDFVFPEFQQEKDQLELRGLGHPLIPDQKRVVNDLMLDSEKVVIITGANMAGKSTYLRSLGINTVLAYTGSPVCATHFRIPFMRLCSSMRTADSLRDEESYFLAEIRKLQVIVRRMETGTPLLILLDEVLKGTNTTDKKLGSEGLIRKAIQYPVHCFIATHDLSLGKLEDQHPGDVTNYCFESYIRGMELSFDYTIQKGIATNMNASFLMRKMGIMD